ncbi:MAG: FAD-dependent oxidoreductase [Firmicutes bacterium]|nr:FAD-dependent oxidoreductase [Bacillota bacterium]
MSSIWKTKGREFGELSGDVECDVAIIGGGVAGLWCAYHLVKAGKKVCVLEAKFVGSGVTAGSSAILTYAHDLIYKDLGDKGEQYLKDAQNAIKSIRKIYPNLEPIKFTLFSTKKKGLKNLRKEVKAYKSLGLDLEMTTEVDLPYPIRGALEFDAFQFNPLDLINFLADEIIKGGGQIFEDARVIEAPDGETLSVNDKTITAKYFIVATHFPYINKLGFYWLKMYQGQNYCIAFKDKTEFCKGISYESIDETGFEYRRVGDDILMDGVSVRVGKKSKKDKFGIMERHLSKHFGKRKEVARFVAQDCITLDRLPYAGRYSHFTDNVFVVSGFNKWGMTSSFVTAKIVTDIILGKADDDSIYSPQRMDLVVNSVKASGHVGNVLLAFLNKIVPGPACSHMGCRMKWNRDTKTWDCPCHGSRFDKKGQLINGPATTNLKVGCRGSCRGCASRCA